MKSLLPIALYMTCCFASCGQKNCKIADYHTIKWQRFDSTTSFYICSNSDTKLALNDFVEIEYLGILQKDENLVIQNETDKSVLSLLTATKFGQFQLSDTTLSKDIRYVLSLMTNKSEATVKVNLGSIRPIEFEKKVTVYFKHNIDSKAATKWINELKTKPFVDSTYYVSQEEAIKNWSKDQADSSWISFLKDNPLPSSVDIFVKPNYFDTVFIKNLKDELLQSDSVSDVMYSNSLAEENLKEVNKLLSNTYLIRIKPKE